MKQCKYDCGTKIEWDGVRRLFLEIDTNQHHSYKRCKQLLINQGKQVPFD